MKKLFVFLTICFAGAFAASAQNAQEPAHSVNINSVKQVEKVNAPSSATNTKAANAAAINAPATTATTPSEHKTCTMEQKKGGKSCCKKGQTCEKKAGEAKPTEQK